MLDHVGEFASSRSAMNTFAPELRALMIILRSVGPVISTRRSSSSGGIGATTQDSSRMPSVSGGNDGKSPPSSSLCRNTRR